MIAAIRRMLSDDAVALAVEFAPDQPDLVTGRSQRRLLGEENTRNVVRSEASFAETLRAKPVEGEIELF